MALQVSFVRHRGRRDRVYVTRQDGSSTAWDFPSYGDRLPHDLCHLVVEEALGIAAGFWGLVDQGVEVELVDNQATLVRDGRPLLAEPGIDFSDLMAAEEAVALLGPTGMRVDEARPLAVGHFGPSTTDASGPGDLRTALGFALPVGVRSEVMASLRRRLAELEGQWRALGDGDAITLTFAGRSAPSGPG
jgi:hypothetical protein